MPTSTTAASAVVSEMAGGRNRKQPSATISRLPINSGRMPMCRRRNPPRGRETIPSSRTSEPIRPARVAGTFMTFVRTITTHDPTTTEIPNVAICINPSNHN